MFQKRRKLILILAGLGAVVAVVVFYFTLYPLFATENERSRDVIAPTIPIPSVETRATGNLPAVGEFAVATPTLSGNERTSPVPSITAPTLSLHSETSPAPSETTTEQSTFHRFRIVSEESEVRFIINEELGGRPNTVIGRTNQVAGEMLIDVETPANSIIGPLEINLRTLATDQELRDRAIRARILRSGEDAYEFTTFVPKVMAGLPETVTVGEPFTFSVTGDLTLVDVTNPVTFQVTVTPVSEERLEGSGVAQVLRSDYGIEIPQVPSVANVTNEVALEIDFVAVAIVE